MDEDQWDATGASLPFLPPSMRGCLEFSSDIVSARRCISRLCLLFETIQAIDLQCGAVCMVLLGWPSLHLGICGNPVLYVLCSQTLCYALRLFF